MATWERRFILLAPTFGGGAKAEMCERCGALVGDIDAHWRWHQHFNGDIPPNIDPPSMPSGWSRRVDVV